MAFGENQMAVYLAGGFISGRLVYHDVQYKTFDAEAPKAFILFRIEEDGVIARFRKTTWGFPETYRRAVKWAESHQLPLRGDCYERYVIDIYTSDDPTEYITEILLPLDADPDPFNYLEEQAKNDH